MTVDQDLRVPVGPEAGRWVTVEAERTVLAVARTVTSTLRVLDVLRDVGGDPRVQVVFAVNDSTPFVDGVRGLLEAAGARVMPWRQVSRLRFDLVVTASENTELGGVDAPVLVLPHGIGFNKWLPDSRGLGRRLSGSPRLEDVQGRRVVMAVSHPDQAEQLRTYSPYLADRAVVVVDPVCERLRASTWFRERYRDALGVAGRQLVVLNSTWGRQSLLGRWPDLPVRLLGELPVDEYRVAAVLHPNIWSAHGRWQVRSWLARASEAGLMVVPPEGSWPAALVAADCVIADHGSVSLYAAAADRPLLLAPFGDEVVAGTAMAALGSMASRLDATGSLRGQVAAATAGHLPGRYQPAVSRAFAAAPLARSVRSVVYELMSLPEPVGEPPLPGWGEPEPERTSVTSYAMYSRFSGGQVEIRRIPAAVDVPSAPAARDWWRHLAVDDREWDLRMVHSASTLVRYQPSSLPEAEAWARTMLDRLPGARLTASSAVGGCAVFLRDGRRVDVTTDGHDWDPMLLAALVWTLRHADQLVDATVPLRVAGVVCPVRVRLRP